MNKFKQGDIVRHYSYVHKDGYEYTLIIEVIEGRYEFTDYYIETETTRTGTLDFHTIENNNTLYTRSMSGELTT